MLVHFMMEKHGVSERQACKALCVPRSSYQYKPKVRNDTPVINELQEMVSKHPAIGWNYQISKNTDLYLTNVRSG